MKTALVPLVLLGAKASGCHLRGVQPAGSGDLANESGLFSKLVPRFRRDEVALTMEHSPQKKKSHVAPKVMQSKRQAWRAAKMKMTVACYEETKKNHCVKGSGPGGIFKMARCLSSGPMSTECETAIKDWKHVMAPSAAKTHDFDVVGQAIHDPDLEDWLEEPYEIQLEDEMGEPAGFPSNRGVLPLDELFLADTIRVRHSQPNSPPPRHYDRPFGPTHSGDGKRYGLTDEKSRHDLQVGVPVEHGGPEHRPPHISPYGYGPGHIRPPDRGPGHAPPPGRGPPGRKHPGHRHPDDGRDSDSMFSVLVDWLGGGVWYDDDISTSESSDSLSSDSSDSWPSDSSDSSSSSDSSDLSFFSKNWRQNSKGWEKSELSVGGRPGNYRDVGRPGHSRVFRRDDKGFMLEEAFSHNSHAGFHEHNNNNRHDRGDHIRFRNRLPDEYEDPLWLDDLDLDDGVDFVEGVLGFFFFIGAITLMSLPFFLLAMAIKRMVLLARRTHSSAASASPEGYRTLPEAASDDEAVVVTGTPVNPPPSAHT